MLYVLYGTIRFAGCVMKITLRPVFSNQIKLFYLYTSKLAKYFNHEVYRICRKSGFT